MVDYKAIKNSSLKEFSTSLCFTQRRIKLLNLLPSISLVILSEAFQEIDYDVISVKQPTPKGSHTSLTPLPSYTSKESQGSRNLQTENSL
jgi:hypothetical protein